MLLKDQAFKSGSGQEFTGNKNLNPKIEARPCQGSILSSERFVILSLPPAPTTSHVNGGAWREGQSGQMTWGLIQTLEVLSENPHDALPSPPASWGSSKIKLSTKAQVLSLPREGPLCTLPLGPLPFLSRGQCSQHSYPSRATNQGRDPHEYPQ